MNDEYLNVVNLGGGNSDDRDVVELEIYSSSLLSNTRLTHHEHLFNVMTVLDLG